MSSIKQLIINAIIKVSGENPALNREGEPTAEQARDDFIRLLMAELFPEDSSVSVPVVVPEPAAEPASAESSPGKKKRAPMTEEAKAAMKAKREATIAAKKAAAGEPAAAAAAAEPALEEGEVKVIAVEPVKEKKARKPKAAPEDVNVAKIDPTWRKHIKSVDKKFPKEREAELLTFLNGLSKEEFNAKKAEEHVADFLKAPVESDGKVEAELVVVEFNGKEYFVNPETKRVYEGEGACDAEGNWANYKGVGYVGMAAFAEMKLED